MENLIAVLSHQLTWIILLPILGSLIVYTAPTRSARWLALAIAGATFALTIGVFLNVWAGGDFGNLQDPALLINRPWIDFTVGSYTFKIDFFLGVDGLSLPMILLNGLLTVLAIIGGWEKKRVKEYMALLLFLEGGVMGVFMALDLFLFFLFWEIELAPMFLLIGFWGSDTQKHGMPGRVYSAWKFLLYTFFGSVFMLAGILLVFFTTGTANAQMLAQNGNLLVGNVEIPWLGIMMSTQLLAFLLIFMAFAVKLPMFPFHTWLPDAHTDAPTEVSVILAGVLLKMGAYGLIRFCVTLFPDGAREFAGVMVVLAVINILYGAAICLVQTDMKKLIAYSSVSHMGIVILGVAAAVSVGDAQFREVALTGATLQMVSHGLITGLLFFCVGVIYDHAHTRQIADFGGVAKRVPVLGTLFTFAAMASLGLPGLAGFVAEYMVFTSSFRIWPIATGAAVFTMIFTAGYLLWMIKRVFFGQFNPKWQNLADANWRELIPLVVLAVLVVIVGIYPTPVLDIISSSLSSIMQTALR